MKSIFTRPVRESKLSTSVREISFDAVERIAGVKDDENLKISKTELFLPIYYTVVDLDGKNYGKAVKCYKDEKTDKLTFTDEIIDFCTTDSVVGYLYKDKELTNIACKKYINTKLEYLYQYLIYAGKDSAYYNDTKIHFNMLAERFLKKERVNLNKEEMISFGVDYHEAMKSEDSVLLEKIKEVKRKYKEIRKQKGDKKEHFMPIFCGMNEDFALITICIKCYKYNNEVEFSNEFFSVAGFDMKKLGNIYLDDELSCLLTCEEIKERLTNMLEAINFLKGKEIVEVEKRRYDSSNETEKAFYAVAKQFLESGNPFENEVDKQNEKIIIAKVKDLSPEELKENLFKIKDRIDYIDDEKTGVRIYRQRKKTRKSNGEPIIDMRSVSLCDVEITCVDDYTTNDRAL